MLIPPRLVLFSIDRHRSVWVDADMSIPTVLIIKWRPYAQTENTSGEDRIGIEMLLRSAG